MRARMPMFVIISLVVSVAAGLALQDDIETAKLFQPLGTIYIRLIKMIMVPLVFTSLMLGVSSIADIKKIGAMGVRTIAIFLGTTAAAVIIGLLLSNIFQPGVGIAVGDAVFDAKPMPEWTDVIVGIFPDNVLAALLNGNMLQIIFVAVLTGLAVVAIAPRGIGFRQIVEDMFEITSKVTRWVMMLTPIGILGLMIPTAAQNGLAVLMPLGKLILVFYLAVIIQMGGVYTLCLKVLSRRSVKDFFTAMFPAQAVAFASCSSAAALPISLKVTQERLGLSKAVSGFVLPLGATVNMDGNALYQGIVSLFIAQAYGIELTLPMQALVVLTGTMASIGAAGVPGAGMIVLSTVLASVGLPIDGVALVAGIDRVLDMGRTCVNITGDAMTACAVEDMTGGK